jgi:hypothetical protein
VKKVLDILLTGEGFSISVHAVASLGLEAFIVLIIGGVVLAIPVGLVTYSLSLYFFNSRKL